MNGWGVLGIIAVVGLIALLVHSANENEKRWNTYITQEYQTCLDKKESEYTCKAYTASLEAKRSADSARTMATMSVITSSINASTSGSKR